MLGNSAARSTNPNEPIDQIQMTLPNGEKGSAQIFADWLADTFGLSKDWIYTAPKDLVQQVEEAAFELLSGKTDEIQKAGTWLQASGIKRKIPAWIQAQNQAVTAYSFVQMIDDIEKGGLNNDLSAFAAGLQIAGLLPGDINPKDITNGNALTRDSSYVAMLNTLLTYFQQHGAAQGFAAAASVASAAAGAFDKNVQGMTGGAASYLKSAAAILNDLSLIASSKGAGSLQRDLQYVQAADSTATALLSFFANGSSSKVAAALGEVAGGVTDVLSIIQGFEQGGVLGGLEAGWSANALIDIISENISGLGFLGPYAAPIAAAIGLAALFFGGNHDNPANMPDKYDEPTYGQGVANLQGQMGANGQTYTEDPSLVNVFSGRTGIQMVEETLAQYQTQANAPAWLQPMFNKLEAEFGESATGAGRLSIGNGGTGKDCNNQQIVGVPGVDGQVYQYTQLDSALNQFQAAYAKAVAAGQAMPMTWRSAADPGSVPPSDDYTSQWYYA